MEPQVFRGYRESTVVLNCNRNLWVTFAQLFKLKTMISPFPQFYNDTWDYSQPALTSSNSNKGTPEQGVKSFQS